LTIPDRGLSYGFTYQSKDKYAYKHPAMFPEQLAEDHILTWSNPGDIVFDPFLGSG
jgi:DNA modification methylase